MCGIAGLFHFSGQFYEQGHLDGMLNSLWHRGPDGSGMLERENIAIGMTRLAIIDVEGGQQPILSENGELALVCNGEIYNHGELREELELRGHQFRTHSDVEVILHLYEEVGTAAFGRLNGMFAVAIADYRSKSMVLARDPFGQKPLYLMQTAEGLAFASELKALKHLPGFPTETNPDALLSFHRFRYIPHPQTVFCGVEKLSPGSLLRIDSAGERSAERYFQVDLHPSRRTGSDDSDGNETYRVLRRAVERHLMSERPLGVYLSGGLDSSAIVALMSDLGVRDIRTYTVGCKSFRNNEFGTARAVAEHFKTKHVEVEVGPEDFVSALSDAVYYSDEPMADLTAVLLHKLSAVARKDVVVVLSGEGSDEFSAGYGGSEDTEKLFSRLASFRKLRGLAKAMRKLPLPGGLVRKLETVAGSDADYLARVIWNCSNVFSDEEVREEGVRCTPGYDPNQELRDLYRRWPEWDGTHLLMGAQIEWWLPDDLLHKADRMSMANSIELRCPFLDLEYTQHCSRLMTKHKVDHRDRIFTRKIALKRAFRNRLPAGIATQPKLGFPLAAYTWLENELSDFLRYQLGRSDSMASSIFSQGLLNRVADEAQGGSAIAQAKAWNLIVLNLWADRWLMGTAESRKESLIAV